MFFHFQNDFPFFEHLKISLKVIFIFFEMISSFLVFSNFSNWFLFFWINENQFEKWLSIFQTDFQFFSVFSFSKLIFPFLNKWKWVWKVIFYFLNWFPLFSVFSLLKWLMKISLKSFNFIIYWWKFFIFKKWILASQTSKKYNRQKWNLFSSSSPLSKVMSILLFLLNSSLFSWFFCHLCGNQLILTVVLLSPILFRFSFYIFRF